MSCRVVREAVFEDPGTERKLRLLLVIEGSPGLDDPGWHVALRFFYMNDEGEQDTRYDDNRSQTKLKKADAMALFATLAEEAALGRLWGPTQ